MAAITGVELRKQREEKAARRRGAKLARRPGADAGDHADLHHTAGGYAAQPAVLGRAAGAGARPIGLWRPAARRRQRRFSPARAAGAALAASNQLAPHLVNRQTLYLLRYPDEADGPRQLPQSLKQVDYAIADALFDLYLPVEGGYGGGLDGDREAIGVLLRDGDFGLVGMRDGLLLFQRAAPPERTLANTLELLPDDGAPAEQSLVRR